MDQDLGSIRKEYLFGVLDEKSTDSDPIKFFQIWYQEALVRNLPQQTAFTLSTISNKGRPTSRIVLLKEINEGSFLFYTNYKSRKGEDLKKNAHVACNFYWPELDRQVRIEGTAKKISKQESDRYFKTRPKLSQLGAWASPQSEEIKSRKVLEERIVAYDLKFKGQEVPRPKYWGGYRITPEYFEFWQGREGRLHDRIVFTKSWKKWKVKRIAP